MRRPKFYRREHSALQEGSETLACGLRQSPFEAAKAKSLLSPKCPPVHASAFVKCKVRLQRRIAKRHALGGAAASPSASERRKRSSRPPTLRLRSGGETSSKRFPVCKQRPSQSQQRLPKAPSCRRVSPNSAKKPLAKEAVARLAKRGLLPSLQTSTPRREEASASSRGLAESLQLHASSLSERGPGAAASAEKAQSDGEKAKAKEGRRMPKTALPNTRLLPPGA